MRYVTAVRLTVDEPEACADFLCRALGYQRESCETGILLSNGCTPLWLVEGASDACLQVHCTDVAAEVTLMQQYDAVISHDSLQQQGSLLSQTLHTCFGLCLCFYRILNEDEMDVLLPLPCHLPWDEATDTLVRRVLRIVPVDFRQKARQRVAERAEFLTLAAGDITVQQTHAIQALRDVTLDFQQQALTEALQAEGITEA